MTRPGKRIVVRATLILALAATIASPASALDDGATSPLDRAAMRSLPSVYRVTVRVNVAQLADDRHRVRIARTVEFTGTAFGAGPNAIVTARHLVRPAASTLLAALQDLRVPGTTGFDPNDVRVTSSSVAITLRRASPRGGATTDVLPATIAQTTSSGADADLALLRTQTTIGPSLVLDDQTSRDTPIAILGYGNQRGGLEPAVRPGTIDISAKIQGSDDEDLVALRGMSAASGDSGGPVIDAQGHVHGVLIRRALSGESLAFMTRSSSIRRLASNASMTLATTPSQSDFAFGMNAFWDRDYTASAQALTRTAIRLPDSAWIAAQAARASELADADYRVVRTEPWRLPLIVAGLMALAMTVALAIRFWTMED